MARGLLSTYPAELETFAIPPSSHPSTDHTLELKNFLVLVGLDGGKTLGPGSR
jgi:hypothetical protein